MELGESVPWFARPPDEFVSSFEVNISTLVKSHGRAVQLHGLPDVSCWSVNLQGKNGPLQLQIYKEKNGETGSELCDQCRIIGWQNHPVCHHRWHIIVPVVENMYVAATSTQDLPAAPVEGKQLMVIWDNLCQLLRAREISVEDVSNKGGMELRVLHAAAFKNTWYGQWGYQYGRGAFNITHSKWKKAVDAVHRAKLALMLTDFAGIQSAVPSIVARYKVVEKDCNTLGALLQRILGLLSKQKEAADLFARECLASGMAAGPSDPGTEAMLAVPVATEARSVKPEPNLTLANGVAAAYIPNAASVQQSPAPLSHDSVKLDQPSGATSELAGQLKDQAATTSSAPPLTHTLPPVPPATDAKLPIQLKDSTHHGKAVALTAAGEPQGAPSNSKDQQLHVRTGASRKPGPALHAVAIDMSDAKLSGSIAAAVALVNAGKQGRARGKPNGYDTVLLPREAKKPKLTTGRAGRPAPAPMPAGMMHFDMSGLTEVDLSNAPKRWSEERCRSSLAKVMGALKTFEGWWVPRTTARQEVQKYMGDTGMMDYMLKAVANHSVGPWVVFRQMDPKDSDRNLFYLLLKKDGSTELPALDAAYSAPQQPINPAAAPSVPASSKLPAAPQQTISDPEALLVALQQPMDVSSATIEFPSAEPEHQQGLAGSETVAVEPRQPVVHFAEQESALHLHQPSEGNAAPQGLTSEQCDMMSTATCMQSGSGDLQQATAAEADTGAAGPLLEQAPHADQAQPPGSQSEHHVLHQLDEPELKPGIGSCNCDVPIMCNAGAWQTQAAPMQPPHTYKAEQEPQPILIQTHTSAAAQQPATSDQVDISHNHTAPSQFLQPPETAQSEARPAPWSHTSTQCQPALVVRHDNTPVQQQLQQIHQPSEGITRAPTSCPAPEASPPTDASAAEPPTHPEQPQSANIPPDTLPGNQSVSPDPQLPAQTLALGVPLTSGADTNLVPPGAGLAAVAVTSPRQGELRGVLGAACSQIIAKQQARSPNAFLQHQSPRGASPTQQHPLSPTSIQHLTDHHIVKAGSSQHGVLHIHYDDAPSPGRQATHSPVQQAVHHTGQLPVQQAPQPPEQLPLDRSQELEDEWTNMLIDLPETAQHDAAQMPSVDHLGALEVSSPLSSTPTASFPCLLNADQHAQDHLEVADVEMQDAADASDPSDSLMHPPASAAAPEAQPPEAELQQPTAESDRGLPKVTLPSQQMPAVVIDIQYHGRTGSLTEAGQLPSEQPSPKPSVVPPTAPPPSVIHQDTRMGLQQSDEALDATTSTDVSAMVDCTHLHADQQQLALQQSAQYANPLKLDEGDVASAGAEQAAQPDEAPTDQQDACEHDAALQEPPADLTEQATLDDVGTEAEAERPHTRSTRLSQSAIMNQEAVLEKPAAPADHASNVPTALSLPEQSSQPDPEASELEAEHTAVAKEMHRTDPNSSVHAVASPPALLEQACDEPMQLDASPSDLPQSSEPHQDEQDADHVLVAASASAWDTATDRPRTRLRRSLESATIRQLLQDTAPAEQQMATCAAASDVHKPTQPPCQAELLSAAQLEDTVVDDTADAVAREKPHTRLRRSLQGAAESPSIAAKDAKAISPQCKLKSKLQQKSPTHKPKQQDQHAKHGSRAGTLRKPQSPQYTPAAKHQPQQQLVQQAPSGKSPSKASSKGMAVVKNGKRKRSGLHHVEARDDTPAVGPSSKLSKSPAAEQKRSSIPSLSGNKRAKLTEAPPVTAAEPQPQLRRRSAAAKGPEAKEQAAAPHEPNMRPHRASKQHAATPTPMQLDAAADPATVSQNAVKQESRPPSSKRSNAKPKLSPSKHHQSGKTSAASSHKAVKTEHSPLHGMAKGKAARGDCLAEVGDADMLAPKREGESADLSMRENRLQGEHAQGKLQEVQEGQGSPVVPSRLRRKITVDYHEGFKRRVSASGAHPLARRRRAAPDIALASSRPPPILVPQSWHSLQPGAPFLPGSGLDPRDQVLSDLVYLFNNTLRAYAPAEGHEICLQLPAVTQIDSAVGSAGVVKAQAGQMAVAGATILPAAAQNHEKQQRMSKLKLKQLAQEAQALRDVKHFVKDYQGHLALPLPHLCDTIDWNSSGQVRLLLQVLLSDEAASPALPVGHSAAHKPATAASAAARVSSPEVEAAAPARRPSLPPPVHPLVVPRRSSLAHVRKSAQLAMADVYTMLQSWQVVEVQGLEGSELRNKVGANIADGSIVSLTGIDMDPNPVLRHAGGFEDWVVSCSCGTRVDDGERMVACDLCGIWMHTRCQGMPDAEPIPDEFVCYQCTRQ